MGLYYEDTDPFMKANNITLGVRLSTHEFAKDESKKIPRYYRHG